MWLFLVGWINGELGGQSVSLKGGQSQQPLGSSYQSPTSGKLCIRIDTFKELL